MNTHAIIGLFRNLYDPLIFLQNLAIIHYQYPLSSISTQYNYSTMTSSIISSALSSPTLPPLQPPSITPLQSELPRRRAQLPVTNAYAFTHNLFSRTLLDTTPAKIQIRCMQPNCHYQPPNWSLQNQSTSNLIRHYEAHHQGIPTSLRKIPTSSSNSSEFFTLRPHRPLPTPSTTPVDNAKYRRLLLDFVVANNLALRIVDTPEYQALVQFLNP